MKKRLDLLEELQQLDLRIDTLKHSRNTLDADLEKIDSSLVTARDTMAVMQERLTQLETEKGGLEANHAAELENIRRSESHMKEIKTNKEYQAVGREIAAARKQVVELEEQILQKINQMEGLGGEISAAAASLTELEENTGKNCADKKAEIDAVQQDIDADILQREAITGQLPANVLKRYNNLREQRRGQAVAAAREGYCLGCNMHLPPQLYNSLFRLEELIFCPHCQRILVLQQAQGQ